MKDGEDIKGDMEGKESSFAFDNYYLWSISSQIALM